MPRRKKGKKMFIYVMDDESRDKLVARGYKLLKHNGRKQGDGGVWVFLAGDAMTFAEDDIKCVASDVLTF